jgi:uncharacterized membrane protein
MKKLLLFISLLPIILANGTYCSDCKYDNEKELILDFHSKIVINPDTTLTITETITINAQHDQIKRGITRAYPTKYRDQHGNNFASSFDIKKVLVDNKPCTYFMTSNNNYKVLNTGNDFFISRGVHVYKIKYQTKRQLKFDTDWTELYFNVIGNDTIFPILKASADLYLPTQITTDKFELNGYTGFFRETQQHYKAWITGKNSCHFETTSSLLPYQGFTISVAFPANDVLVAPSFITQAGWFIQDNLDIVSLFLCLFLLIMIYGYAWLTIYSNQPVITPLFAPPAGMLPADCLYLYEKKIYGTSRKALTATIIDMAIHGYLTIKYQSGKFLKKSVYTLIKNKNPKLKISNYDNIAEILFDAKDEIEFTSASYENITKSLNRIKFNSQNQYAKYIESKTTTLTSGIFISIGASLISFATKQHDLLFTLFLIIIIINLMAIYLLKDYTPAGKQLYAQVAGFRMYLNYAEKDRIERLNPPSMNPKLFEQYLPYAIALDVDKEWNKAFADILELNSPNYHYYPYWLRGHRSNLANLSSDLNRFSTSLNHVVAAPGTNSGRGGGGFSGGGGGGGGVGGR